MWVAAALGVLMWVGAARVGLMWVAAALGELMWADAARVGLMWVETEMGGCGSPPDWSNLGQRECRWLVRLRLPPQPYLGPAYLPNRILH